MHKWMFVGEMLTFMSNVSFGFKILSLAHEYGDVNAIDLI